ncbi:hypothetical protein WKR88_27450 [Trinickia caryophylli]|uniref:Uncharacterized protein n=1 Tax=Trinickia caryophylli TaxID=28094 RepID=A0A1X7EVN2_TRICW|nr:hypothetical protein [Trinickia caryophylli]PMS12192.1 hypothetical protein C0Z17_11515 [Trinickia caryophylli]TRX18499.1 hypothetical protein FNF07_09920 [Trinickia caryophylli]WQE10712.1 hypothetical protein U0034_13010 [Trinickia caryophylli]SMF40696.1 hypothetical protein SAMN06295900_106340 [Trinickia caryophylli]GLU33084.1 hypothetical protein Busp01_29260 [Trinickia caryophylli]
MTDSKEIRAYVQDAAGQLVPLAAESLVLQFPSGDTLEIAWDAPHPDDPRPVSAQVWGGRRITRALSEEEIAALPRATGVALLPSAANLVLIHPDSHAPVK